MAQPSATSSTAPAASSMLQTATGVTVDPEEVARFSAIADEWWDPTGKFKPLHRINPLRLAFIREQVEQHMRLAPGIAHPFGGKSVLDIGCGGGLLSEPMTRLGATVTGIDASEKNIKVASVHARQQGLDIDYQHGTIEALAAAGRQFDIVLNMEVVEHVADVDAFLQAASTVVAPGGVMILSTINRTAKSFALAIVGAEYILRWLPRGTHDWRKFLRPSEVTEMLETHGMQIGILKGMNMHPLTWEWTLSSRDADVNYLLTATKP